MINIQFNIHNPLVHRFVPVKIWQGPTPIEHKFWELEIYKSSDIVDAFFRFDCCQSHAGLHLGLALLGYNIEFQIYDHRHWDYEEEDWYYNE